MAKVSGGVRQKRYAHCNLVAMTRLFTNRGDHFHNAAVAANIPETQTNFTNALAVIGQSLEDLVLNHAATMANCVVRVLNSILRV
ncbi:MAG: hypothetical protein OXE94_03125 [Aestuariivita sp.]|nr:hypothetical protein [Aestuariivita sp.]MCY4201210.1 hypothetical protein [Aestuariivita sp.]MCY4288988.1 hypothetical protein [Aestuariivita sp.]MCY4346577.1 hypothetical protein [Aestuariivita sp.]